MIKRFISLCTAVLVCLSCMAVPAVYADYPSALSARELLKLSLDYCANMDETIYISDSAMTSYKSKLEAAQSLYDDALAADSALTSARSELEKAKAKLKFVQSDDPGNPLPFRKLSNSEVVSEMGAGWNLGNTMDGHDGFHPGETVWQGFITTPEIIKSVHDAGFNTVRIPVTWGDMIDDENGYAINEAWLSRVQDIVDYCTELGMYAIINIHHDGAEQSGWLRVSADDIDSVYEKYACVWRNIAEYFKDYDEHLIFESLNEITSMEGSDKNSETAKKYDVPIIMNLNQIFVNVVRSTGSNNIHRWLSVASHYANSKDNYFSMPTDSFNSDNRLMYAAHIYKASSSVTFEYKTSVKTDGTTDTNSVANVVSSIKDMKRKYGNYPLILGEYGTKAYQLTGSSTGWNDEERAWFYEIVSRACQVAGCVPCVWDQSWQKSEDSSEPYRGLFVTWDRENKKPVFKSITDGMMRGTYLSATSKNKSYDMTDIQKSPAVTPITEISADDEIELTLGETKTVNTSVQPSGTNDVVLWKSDNEDVVTVSNGKIHAVGIGCAAVHAYSQSGSADKEIHVTSLAKQVETPASAIETDADEYSVITGKNISIKAQPVGADENLMYKSLNPAVATVNALGKVVGISEGTSYITVSAESGITKTVKVNVAKTADKKSMNLAMHILYNDTAKNFYGTELSQPVEVSGDGQYTLSFDLDNEQSDAGKKAGITSIQNLTAIYIKDLDVTNHEAAASPVDTCEVRYDKVVVNGTELTVTNSAFKSAFNSDVIDTGGPVNAWGGNAVREVSIDSKNHVASFSTISNPKQIEITFTLQNVHFKENKPADVIPVESLAPTDASEIPARSGSTIEISVNASPTNTNEKITFYSSDESAVTVEKSCTDVSADGTAKTKIHFISDGEVTAVSDSGKTVVFSIRNAAEPVISENKIVGVSGYVGNEMPETFEVITVVYTDDNVDDVESVNAGSENITDGVLNIDGLDIPINDNQNSRVFIWDNFENMRPLTK